jgi:hypothetical protein
MFRTIFLTLLTLTVAIAGGAASLWYALENVEGLGALEIGAWTAHPDYGTAAADPYSEARIARDAELTLGRAEGLTFVADADSSGRRLRRECSYTIEGPVPATRFWTVYAADVSRRPLPASTAQDSALHSYQLLRDPQDGFVITAGRNPAPGNWLPVSGTGAFSLVLTLYDTGIASSSTIADIRLPAITRIGCENA